MRCNKFRPLATCVALLSAASAQAQVLHVQNGGVVTTLDPHRLSGVWENRVVGDLFEGLMVESPEGGAIPALAKRYSLSEDGLIYTFELREDARWLDGAPVTANDFVFALRRLMDPATEASNSKLQYPIKNAEAIHNGNAPIDSLGVRAINDHSLEIRLEQPTPYFIEALAHYTSYPLPKHVIEVYGDNWAEIGKIVTNGPYSLVKLNDKIARLRRNNSFHSAADIAIEEVNYHSVENPAAALAGYEIGDYDIITNFPTEEIARLRKEIPDQLQLAPAAGLYFYPMNINVKPLDDLRVRKALSRSIDREYITNVVLGTGETPAYSWVPPNMPGYTQAKVLWADLDLDTRIKQAEDLLFAAGIGPSHPVTLTLQINEGSNNRKVADAIEEMWKPLGVHVVSQTDNIRDHYQKLIAHDFQLGRASWTMDFVDPYDILFLLADDSRFNFSDYQSTYFNTLMKQSKTVKKRNARLELLREAEEAALASMTAIPIYFLSSRNLVSTKVKGFKDNPFDIHRTRFLSLEE